MDSPVLVAILEWVGAHPVWAAAAVFAAAFAESLIIVGLLVPGAVFMFAAGAFIAAGRLEFAPVWAAAAAGGFAGDLASFWVGRTHGARFLGHRLLAARAETVARARRFVLRHGGKGVLIARFVGPLRPLVPALAATLGMPWTRFLPIAAVGAVLWAPAYLLPGIAVGASLALASEVAGRLVLLLVLLGGLAWAVFAAVHRFYALLAPHAARLAARLIAWSMRHPLLGPPVRALVDPDRPDLATLAVLGPLLALGAAGFAWTLWKVTRTPPPTPFEAAFHQTLQGLRTPVMDHVMVALTGLGGPWVIAPFAAVVLAWLLARGHRVAAAHWAAGAAFALLVPPLLKLLLEVPRPPGAGIPGFAFPSGHATAAAIVYGLAAALAAPGLPPRWRWLPYGSAVLLALGVAVSRLYLGVHWLGDVIGGLTLGTAWAALVGLACRRHTPPLPGPTLVLLCTALVTGLGAAHVALHQDADLARYRPLAQPREMERARWLAGGWRRLPTWRHDLRGSRRHPLTVQAAMPASSLAAALAPRGWRPAPFRAVDLLALLRPEADPTLLPVLPQVHDGRHERLRLVRDEGRERLVLRLWTSGWRLPDGTPILVGTVGRMLALRPLPLLVLPRTGDGFDAPRQRLAADAAELVRARVDRNVDAPGWDGGVLLLAPPWRDRRP